MCADHFRRAEVAALFEPSIEASVASIKAQIDASGGTVKVSSLNLSFYSQALTLRGMVLSVRMARWRVRCEPMALQPASGAPFPIQRHS